MSSLSTITAVVAPAANSDVASDVAMLSELNALPEADLVFDAQDRARMLSELNTIPALATLIASAA